MNPRPGNSRQGQTLTALGKAETTVGGFTTGPSSPGSNRSMNLAAKPARLAGTGSQRGRWSNQKISQLNLPPSEQVSRRRLVKAAGRISRPQCSEVLCRSQQSHGILWPSWRGIVMPHVAREPNHSVNLTRNSVPRWPSEARYAHNAPLVHRVALPRAGYLKR
jgi:hypothetical protein